MLIILLAWNQLYFETSVKVEWLSCRKFMLSKYSRVCCNYFHSAYSEINEDEVHFKCFLNCLVQVNTCMCDLNSEYAIIRTSYKQNKENKLLGINV